jgi:hypothetical protein
VQTMGPHLRGDQGPRQPRHRGTSPMTVRAAEPLREGGNLCPGQSGAHAARTLGLGGDGGNVLKCQGQRRMGNLPINRGIQRWADCPSYATRNTFSRDVSPRTSTSRVFATPSASARATRAASVARPASATSFTPICTTPSRSSTNRRRAPGVSRTATKAPGNANAASEPFTPAGPFLPAGPDVSPHSNSPWHTT